MIGKTLQNLLDEKNINVNELSKMIGVSNQTLYSIIKRDNMKIDFEVLLKICRALNVSVEYFYKDYEGYDKINKPADNSRLNNIISMLYEFDEEQIKLTESIMKSYIKNRNNKD